MPVNVTRFGPGTLTLDPDSTLQGQAGPLDVACQFTSGGVQHEYEEPGDATTVLCGDIVAGKDASRSDSLTFDGLADLTASGLYSFLLANDLADCPFTYSPDGNAEWAGTVNLRLPDSVTADEYGEPLTGSVTWPAAQASPKFTFTPAPSP